MSRPVRRCAAAAALCAAAMALCTAPASARTCDVGDAGSYGTTSVTGITVRGITCAKGKRLVRAFHRCRPGKSGRCARVDGYRCSDSRYGFTEESYDADVLCKRGRRHVSHTYTQSL